MDRILYISPLRPSEFSGGEILIENDMKVINKNFDLDYFGYPFKNSKDRNDLCQNSIEVKPLFWNKFCAFIKGFASPFSELWVKNNHKLGLGKYNIGIVNFSYFPNIVESLKENNISVILRMHNVEYKLQSELINQSETGLFRKIILKRKLEAEKRSIALADRIVVLTGKDKTDLINLYDIDPDKIFIAPVFLKQKNSSVERSNQLLITGSLWYGPNRDGIIWFLESVWPHIKAWDSKITLIIAGSNPDAKILRIIESVNNVKLVINPEKMDTFFHSSDLYIAPIFWGGGIKIKVGQALQYGLPVIMTEHAKNGYEFPENEFYLIANTPAKFIEQIKKILSDDTIYSNMRSNVKIAFKKHLSYEAGDSFYSALFNQF